MKMLLIFSMFCFAIPIFASDKNINGAIPTVSFCEMVKHPKKYFNKTIRLTATFTRATEAQYLSDNKNCPLSHDNQIGIGYAKNRETQVAQNEENIDKIGSDEFGGRAIVTVVGSLKNFSRRDFAWYQYRFDIAKFEKVSHVVQTYTGELDGGKTYRAEVKADKDFGINFVKPYKLPFHYALRLEWTNLNDFPILKNFTTKKIVFSVLDKEIKQMTENRWNILIQCKIIRVE